MAYRVLNGTGNWSSGTNFDTVSNTPTIHASTNLTYTTGTYYSLTFTAPNITNYATGASFHCVQAGTGGTLTVTLQEYDGASWNDKASSPAVSITTILASSWFQFRYTAPYQFTTTSAGYYRLKIVAASITGTLRFAADSGGSNICFLASDDRTGAVGSTDDVYVLGSNGTNDYTVTIDNISAACGSGASTEVATVRSVSNALVVGIDGILTYSIIANSTLTVKGNICVCGGEYYQGTTVTPIPSSYVSTLSINENGTSVNYGIEIPNVTGGKFQLCGASKTYYKTTLSSGVGTAADPAVMGEAVNWTVGDEVWIAPTTDGAYTQGETRYIITVVDTSTYVWSSTLGGAESALTYSHSSSARVFNKTHNVVVTTNSTSQGFYLNNKLAASNAFYCDWFRLDNIGSSTTGKLGFGAIVGTSSGASAYVTHGCLNNVLGYGFYQSVNAGNTKTFSDLISGFNSSTSTTGVYAFAVGSSVKDFTLTDCTALDYGRDGFSLAGTLITLTRCIAIACGQSTSSLRGFLGTTIANLTAVDCESHCNRGYGIGLNSVSPGTLTNFLCGTKGANSIGNVVSYSSTYNDVVFENCYFDPILSLFTNYSIMASGSEVKFHKKDGTEMNHYWYTPEGIGRSTGGTLDDTTVRTADSYAIRLNPDTYIGLTTEFYFLATPGSAVNAYGFSKMNAALVADAGKTIEARLYLPGSTTPDNTFVLTNDTNWNLWNVAAVYSGTIPEWARVEIFAGSGATSGYLYIDDILNGSNVITGLDVWEDGMPAGYMFEQLGDPYSITNILTSTLTTPGTLGYVLANIDDSVWDALLNDHSIDDTFGGEFLDITTFNESQADQVGNISSAVWEEATSSHITTGTTGKKLKDGLTRNGFIGLK